MRPIITVEGEKRELTGLPTQSLIRFKRVTMIFARKCTVLALTVLISSGAAFAPRRPPSSHRLDASSVVLQLSEKKDAVLQEANDALASVGWAAPSSSDGELTSDDPFVQRIDASIQHDMGVGLEDLLNPAKVSLFSLRKYILL